MEATPVTAAKKAANLEALKLDSVALLRLLEEVRNHAPSAPTAYDRAHNRHNR